MMRRLTRTAVCGVLYGDMGSVVTDGGSGDPPVVDLEAAYRLCETIARSHYENFPVVSRLIPPASRRALSAVYAFARGADDLADEGFGPEGRGRDRMGRLEALGDWQRRLEAACASVRAGPALPCGETMRAAHDDDARAGQDSVLIRDADRRDAIFLALADTIRRHDLPPSCFFDLLSAFRQDVTVDRYGTREELLDYCRRSANPVGRIVLAVHGGGHGGPGDREHGDPAPSPQGALPVQALAWSDAICTGLQLANFWQDVAIDRLKDRVYLPLEDCRRFGVEIADLDAPAAPASLRALVLEETDWAQGFFLEGRPLLAIAPPPIRLHLRLVWHGGIRVLEKIRASGGDVLASRPKLTKRDWSRILLRVALGHVPNYRRSSAQPRKS